MTLPTIISSPGMDGETEGEPKQSGKYLGAVVSDDSGEEKKEEGVEKKEEDAETKKPKRCGEYLSAVVSDDSGEEKKEEGVEKKEKDAETKEECENVLDKGPIIKPPMLPVVSLSYGLNRKATAWSLQSWIALSLTLDGRDKITKLVQYGARFMAWWLTNSDSANSQRFMELYQSVAKSRKAFRLGRSVIEIDKLRSMGLVSVALWHLRVALNDGDPPAVPKSRPRLTRKASSNIGWGPSTVPSSSPRDRSFYRSLSNIGYRMYRPMVSQLSLYGPSSQPTKAPAWKIIGSALKIVGLLGFWTADNVSFLTASGFLDNHKLKTSKRLERRQSIQTRAARFAAQSYFMGAVAGLFVNLRSYWSHRQNEIKSTQDMLAESDDEDNRQAAKDAQEKQFELFLALLKSCCDVLAFSNMPGIDLHQKYRGKKMNEGFHCLCGLVSASTVLYSNFPNAD